MRRVKRKQGVNTSASKKKKAKWYDVFSTLFFVVLIGGGLIGTIVFNYLQDRQKYEILDQLKVSMPAPGVPINHKAVCMVNNRYMGLDQIPVLVNDKTYCACCDKCIRDINYDETLRFAIDPYSKAKVDKALAFITMSPTKRGTILYFESEENAKKHLNK